MRTAYAAAPLALALRATVGKDLWTFGSGFYTGPVNNAHITKATWSVVPPSVPRGATAQDADDQPWVALWLGLQHTSGDSNSCLYQPILNWSPDQTAENCPAGPDEWCVAASTYTPHGQTTQAYIPVPKGTQLDFEGMLQPQSVVRAEDDQVHQIVTMDGKVVSKETVDLDAKLLYLYSGNECYTGSGACGTLEAYNWENITVHLSAEDERFPRTLNLFKGTKSPGFTTPDGGRTWHADTVTIPKDSWINPQVA
ncbi:hypothetical protein BDV28DRAFT_163713 [Aspergillus coremiiformis]|uniref:Uncharacterized protein n=1 Tax=Aspergillus coremiiformis TaxID=138285 RepID=A0A5N6YV09_9EURO|nr:hypothetical protein BDV28DRAFT_163713 [Aspergillus coremiiformis]